ncbi:MAG: Crp/Fnr family transcriptional regulator [Anaerolineales bacterium]|nr:Crp/Fnr family transcriptional regulator [Anaerolineae bacterium]PWB53544.1 MAG: Crp/Fnr family transcriptional regulator [Anaerolineales bacterium]
MKITPDFPVDKIEGISLFMGLKHNDVLSLIEAAHEKRLHAGGFYYHQGDPAEYMFVLMRGQVKRLRLGSDGRQSLIEVVNPIQPFGLVAMTGSTYPVTAQAAEDCQAIAWHQHEMMQQVMHIPQLALNAMKIMSEQLSEIQERFHQVTTQRVEQRLAHTLIRLAAQSGKRVKEGIMIDLGLTRRDLAEMSGTTLYTASRTLSQWHGQELVVAGREKVIIRNPHGLIRIIEDNSL